MKLKRFTSFVVFITCVLSGYYLLENVYWQHEEQTKPDTKKPVFTAGSVKSTSYDAQGKRNYVLESQHIEHLQDLDNDLDKTHFTQPFLSTFRDGVNLEWEVRANSAELSENHILIMIGNVTIKNLLPESQLKTVTADIVTLDLSSQDFWTDSETIISGIGFQTRGEKAKGNFDSHIIKLIDKVNTVYESNNE